MSEARNRLLAELYEKYYDSVFYVAQLELLMQSK